MTAKKIDFWKLLIVLLAFSVMIPICVLLFSFFSPESEIWQHLSTNVLPRLIKNTFTLGIGLICTTSFIGVSLAWINAVCDFPGRKIFSWGLLMPFAMPAYVMAFVFLGVFDYSGPVQSFIRSLTGSSNIWFPDIRSSAGVITVMTLAFYPYVYLIAKNAFSTQGKRTLELGQSLGYSRTKSFFKIALPLARPWIAGGLMLVLMETLSDFGAVSIFNYDTFTTAIYKSWFGFFSINAAAQLSSILVIIVLTIILTEQHMRLKMRYWQPGRDSRELKRIKLTGIKATAAFIYSLSIFTAAFILPAIQLIFWSYQIFSEEFNTNYFGILFNSLSLSSIATATICLLALTMAYAKRHQKSSIYKSLINISTIGYALPGTILSVGIVIPVAFLNKHLNSFYELISGHSDGITIQGTLSIMIFAYLIRFMAPAFGSIDSSMHRITKSMDEASASLGLSKLKTLYKIHAPMLKGGILTAMMLVFIDIMKEMPITLIMRPFGWNTLAIKIYELTSEGEWQRAALPALTLVLAGMLPIALLTKHMEKK